MSESSRQAGWYFNEASARLAEYTQDGAFPEGEGNWDFIGGADLTPADAVAALQEKYPEVNIRLKLESKRGPGSGYYDMGPTCEVDLPPTQ